MRESSLKPALFALALSFLLALAARGDDVKPVTITGDGVCAKCTLKEAKSCQNVLVVREGTKEVKYYLAKNKLANDFHHASEICSATKDAPIRTTATGTVKELDGKKVLTATKIELAK
jgi:hypothetical protein